MAYSIFQTLFFWQLEDIYGRVVKFHYSVSSRTLKVSSDLNLALLYLIINIYLTTILTIKYFFSVADKQLVFHFFPMGFLWDIFHHHT